MAIVSLMMAFVYPMASGLTGGRDFSRSVDEVAGMLSRARAQAMAQNSYVWVGFYEEDAGPAPTNQHPPYTGRGRLVMAVVASKDGSEIYGEGSVPAELPGDRLKPLGNLVKITNIHLGDVEAATGGDPISLEGRSEEPHEGENAGECRIRSEGEEATPFPFQFGGYTFYKTIRFSPRGEVCINGVPGAKRVGEIGLIPTKGTSVPEDAANVAAIQFSGIGGNVQIYRR